MPSKVFLGPNLNFWCINCNIPILDSKICPVCESKTRQLKITPPFEITPAFEKDILLIQQVIDNQYGENIGNKLIPATKIILLNKAPYYDRQDEVIVDGIVLGNIRFNPSIMQWEFIPKMEGARRLALLTTKKWIKVDDGAINYIAKGANVLAPGITSFDETFEKNEIIIVLTSENRAIAIGVAKMSAVAIKNVERGIIIKTKDHDFPQDAQILPGGQNWDMVLTANKAIIERRARKAERFIRKTVNRFKRFPKAISFSGGKDSLCLLLLILDAIGPIDVFFIDTGIEFEETINYTLEVIHELDLSKYFILKESRESFWENLEKFGPPAKDYRWCCKVIKLANIAEHLNKNYANTKVVTFIGARRYESFSRHQEKMIWTNSYLPQQIGVAPIHRWSSLYVWMYLLSKRVKINPLYYEGYKRIGCMFCPATKLSELELLKKIHPELYARWMEFLEGWARRYNLSPFWVERGFWRSRKFKERGQIVLASELGISEEKISWKKDEKLKFYLAQGVIPCQSGQFSIEGRIEGYLHRDNIINHLGILGKIKNSPNLGVISLQANKFSLNLFSDGTFALRGEKKALEKTKPIIIALIRRANDCIGCGICISFCSVDALYLKDKKVWVRKNCIACFKCLESCPVLKYTN
ncbi:MAG: phosphoadenosine phosphosulfate reductase domain-containing protein [Candidatus Helarchaeota archaeon]